MGELGVRVGELGVRVWELAGRVGELGVRLGELGRRVGELGVRVRELGRVAGCESIMTDGERVGAKCGLMALEESTWRISKTRPRV